MTQETSHIAKVQDHTVIKAKTHSDETTFDQEKNKTDCDHIRIHSP
ncbi:hypothetical protein GW750_01405 [bacterium]|nr:hypothetical protein [bacterium]